MTLAFQLCQLLQVSHPRILLEQIGWEGFLDWAAYFCEPEYDAMQARRALEEYKAKIGWQSPDQS